MGLTSQWLNVKLSGLAGYEQGAHQPGEHTAVLVKYTGDLEGAPGVDLILTGEWYD